MDIAKHVIVDGSAGFLIGASVDAVFDQLKPGVMDPEDISSVATVAGRLAAQAFVSLSLGAQASLLLYPTAENTDPTNGFFLFWLLMKASPGWRDDMQAVVNLYKSWLKSRLGVAVAGEH
jgi:hypothetical protein